MAAVRVASRRSDTGPVDAARRVWPGARGPQRAAGRGAPVRLRRILPAALLSLLLPACASVDRWMGDRLLDVTDVVDLKHGRAWGLGVKLEATLYLGAGFGIGFVESSREWFGRRAQEFTLDKQGGPGAWFEGLFAHAALLGADGGSASSAGQSAVNAIFLNVLMLAGDAQAPPLIDRWRFGAELLLPEVTFGAYLNLGELWDLLAGLAGEDPAGDDGTRKGG